MNLQIVLVGSESWKSSFARCWRFIRFKEGRRKHNKAYTIELNFKRGLFFSVYVAIAMYFLGAVGLYAWRLTVPNNHMTFTDVLAAPFTMKRISRLQGLTNIDDAREYLENGKFTEAFYNFRAGVARVPGDLEARLGLAKLYIASGYVPEGANLLIRGLDHGYPEDPEYLRILLLAIRYNDNNPALLRLLPKLLEFPEVADSTPQRVSILQLLLRAQLIEQDYAGVVQTSERLNDEDIEKTFYDTSLFARLKMGAYVDAEAYLESIPPEEVDQSDIQLLEAILVYLDQSNEAGRREFRQLFVDFPDQWRHQMDAIMFLYDENDTAASETLMNVYATIHRGNPEALTTLTARLADVPDPPRVLEFVKMVGQLEPRLFGAMSFYYVQSLITQGDFVAADRELVPLRMAAPTEGEEGKIFTAFDLIVKAGVARSKAEFTELRKFLHENRMTQEIYWEAAEAMRKIGEFSTAEVILNSGLTYFPFSDSLSRLRNLVLQQASAANEYADEAVAAVNRERYSTQRVSSTDQIAERMVGHDPAMGIQPSSIVDEENLRDIDIDIEDFNKSAETN